MLNLYERQINVYNKTNQTNHKLVQWERRGENMQVNMYEAKTKLTKLVRLLDKEGEIVLARNGKPVAKLVPYVSEDKRPIGLLKGKYTVPEDIDACNDEIAEIFGV